MHTVPLPRIGTATAWRDAARRLIGARVPPDKITWNFDDSDPQLFETSFTLPDPQRPVKVAKDFVSLADTVVWHRDPQRFARLYTLLWRLRTTPSLMQDRADPDLAKLRQMEKNVRRCQHKMKAFVRFRDLRSTGPRRSFGAWFEPTHHTVEPTAAFFMRRFADMDWIIATPDVTAQFKDGQISFMPGTDRPDLPEDAAEALWGTYFCNIFNPARVKINAMTSEMPKKYWKNMPEAQFIPGLIADAERKVQAMRDAAPTLPPERVTHIRKQLTAQAQPASWNMLEAEIAGFTAPGFSDRAVHGSGPRNARLMIVGEQPGDQEDLQGRPFVGPAGHLLHTMAGQVGLDLANAYLTNAVKHFKFQRRGKLRLHQSPTTQEIDHCKWWLHSEIALVKPELIIALGATAARALTGNGKNILTRRGTVETGPGGVAVFLTTHPSHVLRMPPQQRAAAEAALRDDLQKGAGLVAAARQSVH